MFINAILEIWKGNVNIKISEQDDMKKRLPKTWTCWGDIVNFVNVLNAFVFRVLDT